MRQHAVASGKRRAMLHGLDVSPLRYPNENNQPYPVRPDEPLVVGLVNNMPPAAMRATVEDVSGMLAAAAQGREVTLRHFVLPGFTPLSDIGNWPVPANEDIGKLWGTRIDALIVTGAEPAAASITEEPSWPTLARLVDWAATHTVATIWSCLAAQAAVFCLDGLHRQPLAEKLSGVFACAKASDHCFLAAAPSHWPVPHSRYNTLDETALAANGYDILSSAPGLGADMFVKPAGRSLFLFLLGHPEYGADRLLREYRRDIKRFIVGQRGTYPHMPECYFAPDVTRQLNALREAASQLQVNQQASQNQLSELLAAFDAATVAVPANSWRQDGIRLYASWLSYIAGQKQLAATAQSASGHYQPVRP